MKMDIHADLEQMAQYYDEISSWCRLFGYSYEQAALAMQQFRIDGPGVSDEEWANVKEERHAAGYNRETYEYLVHKMRSSVQCPMVKPSKDKGKKFLFRLHGYMATAFQVMEAAGLSRIPEIFPGTNDGGKSVDFCRVDAATKQRLVEQLTLLDKSSCEEVSRRYFIVDSFAEKELAPHSLYPTLGLDSTMPQHRPDDPNELHYPLQDQYPVFYFFYGTLGDSEKLTRLLDLQEAPRFHNAIVKNGELTDWDGTYKGLVDGDSEISGLAYEVANKEDETRLQYYETHRYEVVRVSIDMEEADGRKTVPGLTFRFITYGD